MSNNKVLNDIKNLADQEKQNTEATSKQDLEAKQGQKTKVKLSPKMEAAANALSLAQQEKANATIMVARQEAESLNRLAGGVKAYETIRLQARQAQQEAESLLAQVDWNESQFEQVLEAYVNAEDDAPAVLEGKSQAIAALPW